MSRFETTLTKRLSLDSNTFNRLLLSGGGEQQNDSTSSEKKILRYSYNLGKHRDKLHRTASIGGNIANTVDGNLAKLLLGRRELPRSLSMESQAGQTSPREMMVQDNTLKASNYPHLTKQFSIHTDVEREDELANTCDIAEKNLGIKKDLFPADMPKVESDASAKEIVAHDKKTTEGNPKKLHHSDSVPDLRFSVNRLEREDFSGQFTSEVQSRPVCRLRRAARRLGVSLSSEDLYHRQRRNGVCNEIDTAAENRKLLRVLNKRF